MDDATTVRVVRAILGLDSQTFAKRMKVSIGTLTNWEKGRAIPQAASRKRLAQLCRKRKLAFLPSGMPVPQEDIP